jgi:hypothetical protein
VKAQRLPRPINVKGYDGKARSAITHILRLHLTIDRRRQYHIPLLILDLGSHDCILGRKWFAFLGVLINAKRHCLRWPDSLQPSYTIVKEITVRRNALLPKRLVRDYQNNINSREQAFEAKDQRREARRISAIQASSREWRIQNCSWRPASVSESNNANDTKDSNSTASNDTEETEATEPPKAPEPFSDPEPRPIKTP